ncbi:MAG: hypothetical protein ACK6DJ_11915, partial [Alphaproteobacteria bacterium]
MAHALEPSAPAILRNSEVDAVAVRALLAAACGPVLRHADALQRVQLRGPPGAEAWADVAPWEARA